MNTLLKDIEARKRHICVLGLGYVGLPLAIELDKHYPVIGFDIDETKIKELRQGHDRTHEVDEKAFKKSTITYTTDPKTLQKASIIIVTVPTPIDNNKKPNLNHVINATKLIGQHLSKNSIIIYESTVYPGVTEDLCRPILEKESKLTFGKDFTLGYSPERISPGDKERTLTKITKVIAASDPETESVLEELYGKIITAGIHLAPSIKVAEAAKAIENTQRDLNVALMNELSIIFNKLNINTLDVIEAAATKWNFMKMTPGLVGGHCIGVDPYYLTYLAEKLNYKPEVILAGRHINDNMGKYIAEQTIKRMTHGNIPIKGAKIGILGITFKENIPDIRNTKVIDIIKELQEYNIKIQVTDPLADPEEVKKKYNLTLVPFEKLNQLDTLIIAVPHATYQTLDIETLTQKIRHKTKTIIDIKSCLNKEKCAPLNYWSL